MNIAETIQELERQAELYMNAANTLRVIARNGDVSPRRGRPAKSGRSAAPIKIDGRRKKRKMSDEAKAKISAKLKAAHARRKAGR